MKNLTQEQFDQYEMLTDLVEDRVYNVAGLVRHYDKECLEEDCRSGSIDRFVIGDKEVKVFVSSYWGYGGEAHDYLVFPKEWLYAEDNVIFEHYESLNKQREQEEMENETEKILAKEIKDKEELKRLKALYEN